MTADHTISDETLAKLGELPTQALIDGLWVENWPQSMIHGARPIFPGQKMVGRGGHAPVRVPPSRHTCRQSQS